MLADSDIIPDFEFSPFSECPVWARLEFAKRIPETYSWNHDTTLRRQVQDTRVYGFSRVSGNRIYVHFEMDWYVNSSKITYQYSMPVDKFPQEVPAP